MSKRHSTKYKIDRRSAFSSAA